MTSVSYSQAETTVPMKILQDARMHLAKQLGFDDGDREAWILITQKINEVIWDWRQA